jgi:hypothetical protein
VNGTGQDCTLFILLLKLQTPIPHVVMAEAETELRTSVMLGPVTILAKLNYMFTLTR